MTGTYCQILGFGLMTPGTSEQSSSPTYLQRSALLGEAATELRKRSAGGLTSVTFPFHFQKQSLQV